MKCFVPIPPDLCVKVKWTASVAEGCTVRGYQLTGTGNLPAMTLTNEGSKTDLVTYHVSVELDGVAMYTYIYKVYVRRACDDQIVLLTNQIEVIDHD